MQYPGFAPRDIAGHRRVGSVAARAARVLTRLLARTTVTGRERVPEGPVVFAPYHASMLDPVVVGIAVWRQGRMPHFLAKDSLFTGPLGRLLKAMGQIPVLRASALAGDSLQYGKQALEAGESVVIYPQGTLTKDPELWPQRSKTGAARLAIEAGVPVVPVAHWGLDPILPVGGKVPRPHPFSRVRVSFCEPLAPPVPSVSAGHSGPAQTRRFADRITAAIAAELAELRGVPLPERFRPDLEPQEDV
ncbi:lysophospholipid acyltransferase family protein [Brevibacterium salitolerans]|uniref:Lysophospholipid acyltransferase family protein n=2 Tax=Brevibacterium TaxID=1696 RepID=A0ABN2X4T0_9MICO